MSDEAMASIFTTLCIACGERMTIGRGGLYRCSTPDCQHDSKPATRQTVDLIPPPPNWANKGTRPMNVRTITDTIKSEAYHRFLGTTVTICCLTLQNGFAVTGEHTFNDNLEFDEDAARKAAFADALAKIAPLEGYLARQRVAELWAPPAKHAASSKEPGPVEVRLARLEAEMANITKAFVVMCEGRTQRVDLAALDLQHGEHA